MELDILKQQILQRISNNSVDKLRFINTPQGHGFAAEEMNNFIDVIQFKDAYVTANDKDLISNKIIKNGYDRVCNGEYIQSKYCNSGSKCISECIDNGVFKYTIDGGGFQKVEVPSDKYDEAIKNFENRIRSGKIKNITDPSYAKKIIIKGFFTQEQAISATRFFTPESLFYDAVNGIIVTSGVMIISGTISFAISIWSGCDYIEALNNALDIALKAGGVAFATHMVSSQLSKSILNKSIKSSSYELVNSTAFKKLTYGVRNANGIGSSNNIINNITKRGIAAIATIVVLSSIELKKFLSSQISGSQAFKNIVVLSVQVAVSLAGYKLGIIAGAKVGLASGNPWGVLVGSIAGGIAGFLAGNITKSIMDNFIEDDAIGMLRIFERAIGDLAKDYLLGTEEMKDVISSMRSNHDMAEFLAFMYYAEKKSRTAYSIAYVIAEYEIENILLSRDKIDIITVDNEVFDKKISNLVLL